MKKKCTKKNKMSDDRERHLASIKKNFNLLVDKKYRAGSKEHQEKLWEKEDLLEELLMEIIDACVYCMTEIQRQKKLTKK